MNIAIGRNTNAMFDAEHRVVGGNATDQALMKFLTEDAFNTLSKEYQITESQAFNSANKFSQARIESLGKTFYKGAPERLLEKATKCLTVTGEVVDLDMSVVNAKIDALAEDAKRVLAFGYSDSAMTENSINSDVVIIGFVGIRDEVRPEAKSSIEQAQKAGIQVVMITGDRLETAVAIAKSAGLLTGSIDVVRDIDIIVDAKFKTFGCTAAIATSSTATEMVKGMTIEEALKLTNKRVVEELGGLPAQKLHCSVLAEEAIKKAIEDYLSKTKSQQ